MKKLFFLLFFLFFLPFPVFADVVGKNIEYTCTVCYENYEKIKCETLISNTLDGVQQMVISVVESKQSLNLDRVTVDCSFPVRSEKNYTGYKVVFELKK